MLLQLVVLAIIIASNNLAASLALGAVGAATRRYRIAGMFGLFEFLIPLFGLWLGKSAVRSVQSHVTWLGPALLVGLGVWTILISARRPADQQRLVRLVTSWGGLVMLAAGLSTDNLIIGFSLGLLAANPLLVAGTIAACSVTFTLVGIHAGREARLHWQRPVKTAAGVLLVLLGLLAAIGWI